MKNISAGSKDVSMWRGLAILFTLCGMAISPEDIQSVALIGAMIVGAIEALLKLIFNVNLSDEEEEKDLKGKPQ